MPELTAAQRMGGSHVSYTTGRWRCMVTGCADHGNWHAAARPSYETHLHYLRHHHTPGDQR